MPFALSHKASKKTLRRNTPSPLDLSSSLDNVVPLPTPPPTAEGSFKMFWQKKKPSQVESPRPYYPSEAPRPILQKTPSPSSPTGIRFTGGPGAQGHPSTPMPLVIVTDHTPPTMSPITLPDPSPVTISPITVSRRSSRPTSPSASSFGARIRTSQCSISSTATMTPASPLSAAPLTGTHITTPPTAYVSTFQQRAPPPPSPYRPTSERTRTSTSFARPLPPLMGQGEMAARPPRHSSLFVASDSMSTLPDTNVPLLNIIPATPQNDSEEFTGAWVVPPSQRRSTLEESIKMDLEEDMDEIPLDPPVMPTGLPSIDINLDFSPFSPLVDLPSSDSFASFPPQGDLPPSPPFESYPSLPSLSSHASMPSSDSDASMPSSASSSSLVSFPDVEEALGSMLASLSESDMIDLPDLPPAPKSAPPLTSTLFSTNPGLGLGLEMPPEVSITQPKHTAPLSPRRRHVPPPLDLSRVKGASSPIVSSAPPCINHRVAFYRTARAAPNSPSSGIFTIDMSETLPLSALDLDTWSMDVGTQSHRQGQATSTWSARDSVSLKSESSDDDLHTASIISLTPMQGDRPRMVDMREEIMLPTNGEVGLAL